MIAISGLKCFESLGKCSPLSSLLKTLMESYRWFNQAVQLSWKARPLSSVRVTTFIEPKNDTSPTSCARISKRQDMPSNRLLFRLAVSAHPTADTACGSSPNGLAAAILPTPVTQGLKVCKNGKQRFMPLSLLPTPLAVEISHTKRIAQLKEKGGKTMGSRANGECRPNGLMDYLRIRSLADTECGRGNELDTNIQPQQPDGARVDGTGGQRFATFANEQGRVPRRTDHAGTEEPQSAKGQLGRADCPQDWWRGFPSVSPVCDRDDGLSVGIPSLTIPFGEWRKNAITALGNSMVPQVVMELFRAIEVELNKI